MGELPNAGPGRGASVRRSHIRRWLQTRYFSPASFPFDFYGRRKVSFGTMVLRCRQWSSLRKSGGPTLFDLFLKGERDNAHNSNSGFTVLPRCYALHTQRSRYTERARAGSFF